MQTLWGNSRRSCPFGRRSPEVICYGKCPGAELEAHGGVCEEGEGWQVFPVRETNMWKCSGLVWCLHPRTQHVHGRRS